MADKTKSSAPAEARQEFRQFAWNIAGTLAGGKAHKPAGRRPRRAASRKPVVAK